MRKSWQLAVNEALYSAEHLSGIKDLASFGLLSEVKGLGQTNVIRHDATMRLGLIHISAIVFTLAFIWFWQA